MEQQITGKRKFYLFGHAPQDIKKINSDLAVLRCINVY